MNPSRTAALSLLFLLGAAAPQGLSAQAGPGAIDGTGGWAPPSLGVRAGYDNKLRKYLLGAQLRLPVLRGGQVELMPSVDVSFLRGRKEQQYNLEAVYVWDGRAGGLYAGAGLGIRNGVFGLGEERRSELGYTIVGGFRVVGLGLVVPQLEYRWVNIKDAPFTYQQLSVGMNIALWQPDRDPR